MASATQTVASRRASAHFVARVAVMLGILVLAVMLAACAPAKPPLVPSDDDAKVTVTVRVVDNKFEPKEFTISQGEAVRWVFEGPSNEHDVVAKDGSFVSELMREGSYTHVFNDIGDFDYLCSIHPEMTGLITVE
ncbi:cupredoxin domain-containing protein [Leucobacter sp. NPDC015123]|uniref:cupredoxin domain-containing protein n=1 Tax=Leucobacter sp. NPDC015123 TaxID=3364129 RepID=UPI0036F488AE